MNNIEKERIEKCVVQIECVNKANENDKELGTGFFVDKNIVITASHVVNKYYEDPSQYDINITPVKANLNKVIKVKKTVESKRNNYISILELEKTVETISPLKFTLGYEIKRDDMYFTFGHPRSARKNGFPIENKVTTTINEHQSRKIDWVLNLSGERLADFDGFSGSPVVIDNMLVGIVQTEALEGSTAISLGLTSIDIIKAFIQDKYCQVYDNLDQERKKFAEECKKAERYLENEEYEDAIKLFQELEDKFTANNKERKYVYKQIGYCYLKNSMNSDKKMDLLKRAIRYFENAVNLIGNDVQENDYFIYGIYGNAYIRLAEKEKEKNYLKALKYIELAIQFIPKVPEKKFELYNLRLDLALVYENLSDVIELKHSKIYLNKAIDIFRELGNLQEMVSDEIAFRFYHNAGRCFEKRAEFEHVEDDLDNALEAYLKAINLPCAAVESEPDVFAMVHNNIGNVYMKKQNFVDPENEHEYEKILKEMIKHYELVLEVYEPQEQYREQYIQTVTNIAGAHRMLYRHLKDPMHFQKSKDMFDKMIACRKIRKDPVGYAITHLGVAKLYKEKAKIECEINYCKDAICHCEKAVNVFSEKNYQKFYCAIQVELGEIYIVQGELNGNKNYFEKALGEFKDILLNFEMDQNKQLQSIIFNNIAKAMYNIFTRCDNVDEAIKYYSNELNFFKKTNNQKYVFTIYYNLAVAYQNKYNISRNKDDILKASELLNEYIDLNHVNIVDKNDFNRATQFKAEIDEELAKEDHQ